jgi:hypothetical protein
MKLEKPEQPEEENNEEENNEEENNEEENDEEGMITFHQCHPCRPSVPSTRRETEAKARTTRRRKQ